MKSNKNMRRNIIKMYSNVAKNLIIIIIIIIIIITIFIQGAHFTRSDIQ